MKSLRFRFLLIFTIVFLCCSYATWRISDSIARHVTGDFFEGSMRLEMAEARKAYETEGSTGLNEFLTEADSTLHGTRHLLDANARDLVSGTDRSQLIKIDSDSKSGPSKVNGQFLIVKVSADKKYYFVILAPPPVSQESFIPYFVLLTLVIVLLGWFLSIGIVSPLGRVSSAVEYFGKGDLKARVRSKRSDEIGDLARSFDSMANRIETLLTAERRLLQDVSHELRSPLARLSFAAELMKGAVNPEEALDRMRREIMRLSQLIGNLLEVTRLEGDPSSQESQWFSFASLAREVVTDCAFEAEARSVEIESQVDGKLELQGNPELIRRALENVLRNAIRFAPQGSSIKTEVRQDANAITTIVRDSGPGVPDELLGRIFDPFVTADESRNSLSGVGVGLGLSIARRAVLLHNGTILAENLNPGLRVTISLPTRTVGAD